MGKFKLHLLLLVLFIQFESVAQTENFRFQQLLKNAPTASTAFAIKNESVVLDRLLTCNEVKVKQITKNWIYVQATPQWIGEAQKSGFITQFYYEFAPPVALNDSSAVTHFVRDVQIGAGGLQTPFTGKDVIIGYVDQGLDYNHPDLLDANGDTRVLYYWDHTLPIDAVRTPQPYGYGQLWYKSDIDNGICTSNEESTGHGTTVTGVGSSDGSATGREKGMAPDSKIIFVETNFNLPNWTLTIADACDFIFKKADSLGLPAVINLSLGSYLGSHDGDDPASELMEQ
ncbi:MAG: S8 family serine peptidase [Fluviicola sp.]|nr:S8 family serine peptidase [Fluviicola sp.]